MTVTYREQFKTFLRAYEVLITDNRKFKRFYKDKRLSFAEKNMLKGFLAFKKGELNEALDILNEVVVQNDFLNGLRMGHIGHCLNNSGRVHESIEAYKESIELLKNSGDHYYQSKMVSSLILTYSNINAIKEMDYYFKILEQLPRDTEIRKLDYHHCKARYLVSKNENLQAILEVDYCVENFQELAQSRIAFLLYIKLMAQFKEKLIDGFMETLSFYKTVKGFKIKENYKYMLSMIKYIYNDASIYAYLRDYDSIPYLYHELNVIKSLSIGESNEAQQSWNFLAKNYPNKYLKNFKFNGEFCLFDVALNKALSTKINSFSHADSENVNLLELQSIKSVSSKIQYILENSTSGIAKDKMISLIWGEEITESNLIRLSTQISRLRKKWDRKILIKNGIYYLEKVS